MTTSNHPGTLASPLMLPSRGRVGAVGLWVLQIGAAGMFLMAAPAKLLGDPAVVQAFDAIGIGQWFRYLTGLIEVSGAVLLLVPSLAFYAALALATTMIGAVAAHLFVLGGSAAPALVLLVVTATIAWARRTR